MQVARTRCGQDAAIAFLSADDVPNHHTLMRSRSLPINYLGMSRIIAATVWTVAGFNDSEIIPVLYFLSSS